MSEPAAREWRFYIDDMIAFAEKVLVYTEGLDQAGFIPSGLNYDATIRNLELIGAAATHVPETIRAAHPPIPWRTSRSIIIRYPSRAWPRRRESQ